MFEQSVMESGTLGDVVECCGQAVGWFDCPSHEEGCYATVCGECGTVERDCDAV